jgi:hypothetical protein
VKYITKLKLAAVHQLCDEEDRSAAYMLQLMQDTCKVNLDACLSYIELPDKEKLQLWKEVNSFLDVVNSLFPED